MPRVKGGVVHARKRKRLLKRAKGFVGGPGTIYRLAKQFVKKAGRYATEHRKQKKRLYRQLWVTRLSAALKQRGIRYSVFIPALQLAGIDLNRKMLSELAIADPAAFDAIVELARPHLGKAYTPAGIGSTKAA
ncbi:MAG: 50S ribosomal protein L20 [Tepidisphaeraceae bacterium]